VSNFIVEPPVMGMIVPNDGNAFGLWFLELSSVFYELSRGGGSISLIGCGC
jgi:hypothetical protein